MPSSHVDPDHRQNWELVEKTMINACSWEIAMNHSKLGQPALIPTKSSDEYQAYFLSGEPQECDRHNPAARITIAVLFFLLVLQLVTGVVLAAPIYSGRR
jgi:hypothetical protein